MAKGNPPPSELLSYAQQYAVSRRFARLQPTSGRIAAFDQLHLELIKASALYESEDLQAKRDAIAVSLMAVEQFLRTRGLAPITARPLMRILSALAERENNNLDPVFCDRPRANRPKASMEKNQRIGAIAAMADYWLAHNRDTTRPQLEQFSEIARKLKAGGLGPVTAATIKQSRELVRAEAADHPARSCYDMITNWLTEMGENFGDQHAFGAVLPILAQTIDFLKN